jgi:O-antigen/teichoic acid export membrane protein
MAWMTLNSALIKVGSIVTQIVLGLLLSHGDFGVYAIAISVAGLVTIFSGGGLAPILVRRAADYPAVRGPIFWMWLSFNVATGLLLFAGAPLAALIYHNGAICRILWIVAIAAPLSTPAGFYQAKLAADLRFKTIAWISSVSALARQALSILFAWAGLGAASFVLPMVFISLFEGIAGYVAVRDAPWRARPIMSAWPNLFSSSRWVVLGSFASLLVVSGDYLTLGRLTTGDIVGIYFFAYQLAAQVQFLLGGNLQGVLLPVLGKLAGQPARQGSAFVRSLNAVAVLSCPITLWIGVIAAPIEELFWHGRWEAAVPVITVLSLTMPFRMICAATKSALESNGRFRAYFLTALADGIANMVAAGIGAALGGLWSISIAIAVYSAASGIFQAVVAAGLFQIRVADVLRGQAPPWVAALLAAAASFCVHRVLAQAGGPLVQLVALSGVFFSTFAAAGAFLFPATMRQFASRVATSVARARGKI